MSFSQNNIPDFQSTQLQLNSESSSISSLQVFSQGTQISDKNNTDLLVGAASMTSLSKQLNKKRSKGVTIWQQAEEMQDENCDPNIKSKEQINQIQQYSKPKRANDIIKEQIPTDVINQILLYLSPKEMLAKMKSLSLYWQTLLEQPQIWKMIEMTVRKLTLQERFKVTSCLVERRSKGQLYAATDRLDGSKNIIRKIQLDVANAGSDDGIPTSFLRELSILKAANHPHIGKIKQCEVNGKLLQIVYPYYEANLKDYFKKKSYLTQPYSLYQQSKGCSKPVANMNIHDIKRIMHQLLTALVYCHRHGIMHRNLKPDNIMFDSEGHLKIVDFCLSRVVAVPNFQYTPEDPKERDRSGREARRLWYRAPELLFRKIQYTFEVDIWAVGCLLGEIALGETLFNGESEIDQLLKIFRLTGITPEVLQSGVYDDRIEYIPKWKRVNISNIDFPDGSKELNEIIDAFIPSRESSLLKLLEIKDKISFQGLDLLWKLLEIDPKKRISAEQALDHQFFFTGFLNLYPSQNSLMPTYSDNISIDHYPFYISLQRQSELRLYTTIDPLYAQKSITPSMRSILVDWLIDVSVHFELMDETLHLTVSYIDRVLRYQPVEKTKLQLLGVACMKIADSFNERSKEYYRQENSLEYSYITADEYSPIEVIKQEKEVLNILDFDLCAPSAPIFIKLLANILTLNEKHIRTACYLSDLLLISPFNYKYLPSLNGASCLFVSMVIHQFDFYDEPNKVKLQNCKSLYKEYSFTLAQSKECIDHVLSTWTEARHNSSFSRFNAVNNKYMRLQPAKPINFSTLQQPLIHPRMIEKWIFTL
ncbi:hypothetical protein FGO68_gene7055 [Halteria grandinella]|uniref:Cyclin-dependent kinase 2 homolog n=1 Tax=Halteria grandinella TaxID=5974 RepID=A0A8J8NZD8_HALGN|nr:hypothetical protein FGO68_gene7055 [Halteria grandinella]